jgi:hypothetical protein
MSKITIKKFGELLKQAADRGFERGKGMGIDSNRDLGDQQLTPTDEIEDYVEQKVANIFDEDDDEILIKCVIRLKGEESPYTDADIIEEFEKFFKNELKGRSPQMALIWVNKVIKASEKK